MHACGFCIWPPAKTRVENCRVVTSNEESEVRVQPHEGAPIGEERGQNKLEDLDYAGGDNSSIASHAHQRGQPEGTVWADEGSRVEADF